MHSFWCQDFCSESFPYFDRKFVKGGDSGDKRDAGWTGDSKIELFSGSLIRNIFYPIGEAGPAFYVWCYFCSSRTQESFGQRLGDERARPDFRLKITLRMKPRESDVYSEARYSQLDCKLARGGEPGRVIVEGCRNQFIADLAVKLFMERFI